MTTENNKLEFIVTKISLDGYEIPVPEGLSGFLNRAGFWQVKEDSGLVTYLTYKGK